MKNSKDNNEKIGNNHNGIKLIKQYNLKVKASIIITMQNTKTMIIFIKYASKELIRQMLFKKVSFLNTL